MFASHHDVLRQYEAHLCNFLTTESTVNDHNETLTDRNPTFTKPDKMHS